jgi:hypothetical protein
MDLRIGFTGLCVFLKDGDGAAVILPDGGLDRRAIDDDNRRLETHYAKIGARKPKGEVHDAPPIDGRRRLVLRGAKKAVGLCNSPLVLHAADVMGRAHLPHPGSGKPPAPVPAPVPGPGPDPELLADLPPAIVGVQIRLGGGTLKPVDNGKLWGWDLKHAAGWGRPRPLAWLLHWETEVPDADVLKLESLDSAPDMEIELPPPGADGFRTIYITNLCGRDPLPGGEEFDDFHWYYHLLPPAEITRLKAVFSQGSGRRAPYPWVAQRGSQKALAWGEETHTCLPCDMC